MRITMHNSVVLTSPMRVGSTWMSLMLKRMLKGYQFQFLNTEEKKNNLKYCDNRNILRKTHQVLASKIHEMNPEAKIIVMNRDIRDKLVSHFCFGKMYKRDKFPDIKDIHQWVGSEKGEEGIKWYCWYALEAALPYICYLTFEELTTEPLVSMKRVRNYLDLDIDDDEIAVIIEKTKFETRSGGRETGDEVKFAFLRKGEIGDYENYMNEEDLSYIKARVKELGGKVEW